MADSVSGPSPALKAVMVIGGLGIAGYFLLRAASDTVGSARTTGYARPNPAERQVKLDWQLRRDLRDWNPDPGTTGPVGAIAGSGEWVPASAVKRAIQRLEEYMSANAPARNWKLDGHVVYADEYQDLVYALRRRLYSKP